MGEKVSQGNPLEQFVLLAKNAKGAATVELIKQALEVIIQCTMLILYMNLNTKELRPLF